MNKSESKYLNTALLMDEALLFILEKKDFEFITVKEICDKAGVNRSTFYLHYESIDDLLVETIEFINKKFHTTFNNKKVNLQGSNKEDLFFINEENLIPYLSFVKENKKVFKLIHDKPYLFGNDIEKNNLYSSLFSPILEKFGVDEKYKEYTFVYYTQGTLAIVLKWIENDCKESVEDIAKFIMDVINYRV